MSWWGGTGGMGRGQDQKVPPPVKHKESQWEEPGDKLATVPIM